MFQTTNQYGDGRFYLNDIFWYIDIRTAWMINVEDFAFAALRVKRKPSPRLGKLHAQLTAPHIRPEMASTKPPDEYLRVWKLYIPI